MLEGHPQKLPAGERFSYRNSGYVVLVLLVERAAGPFHGLHLPVRRSGDGGLSTTLADLHASGEAGSVARQLAETLLG